MDKVKEICKKLIVELREMYVSEGCAFGTESLVEELEAELSKPSEDSKMLEWIDKNFELITFRGVEYEGGELELKPFAKQAMKEGE